MIEKVLPAIKEKWSDRDRNIVIQQDGASAHIDEFDPTFCAAATSGNWNNYTDDTITQIARLERS